MDLPKPTPDHVDALSEILDDESTNAEAFTWAAEELVAGRSPEELVEKMIAQGWDQDAAEIIVESARKETRIERGVLTREEIVAELNAEYRRNTLGVNVGLFGFFATLLSFHRKFLAAIRSLRKLKSISRPRE